MLSTEYKKHNGHACDLISKTMVSRLAPYLKLVVVWNASWNARKTISNVFRKKVSTIKKGWETWITYHEYENPGSPPHFERWSAGSWAQEPPPCLPSREESVGGQPPRGPQGCSSRKKYWWQRHPSLQRRLQQRWAAEVGRFERLEIKSSNCVQDTRGKITDASFWITRQSFIKILSPSKRSSKCWDAVESSSAAPAGHSVAVLQEPILRPAARRKSVDKAGRASRQKDRFSWHAQPGVPWASIPDPMVCWGSQAPPSGPM